jgi:Fe-S-cluster-containing hydrogenase component 2
VPAASVGAPLAPYQSVELGPWLDPAEALARGQWIKWIGGASNHDLVALEDLAGLASLAGAHCLDVAADGAVVAAVRRGIDWARGQGLPRAPWLMLSLSDGEDPHFRKAFFDPDRCPGDCPRPCARVCPARAIGASGAVLTERCYGCGRCLGACPLGLIEEHQQVLGAEQLAPLVLRLAPDALELHTSRGRGAAFARRLAQLQALDLPLKLLSVSCGEGSEARGPDLAPGLQTPALATYLWQLHGLLRSTGWPLLWQLDGRPMTGDLGAGTAQAAVALLGHWRAALPPGLVQLAGGTNGDSLRRAAAAGFAVAPAAGGIAGVAYGGSARSLLQPFLVAAEQRGLGLLACPDLWPLALAALRQLWGQPR